VGRHGFLTALAERALPADADARQLCSRIDLQTRRLLEGSSNVAERLMRDALYLVGNADSNHRAGAPGQGRLPVGRLDAERGQPCPGRAGVVRRRLREAIAATEETWNRFCAGSTQACRHSGPMPRRCQRWSTNWRTPTTAAWCRPLPRWPAFSPKAPSRHSEALAMETATAILLAQNAQENIQYLGSSFSHQVDVMVARIQGCLRGNPPQPGSELPSLDEMSRQAQEKMLVGQVAREIKNNLAQIEQVLDAFFRDADKRADLNGLDTPLRQVIGALSMMRHDGAVTVLRQCAKDIERFSGSEYVRPGADFEGVAEQLSLVGFFVDAMQTGAGDFDRFVSQMKAGTAAAAAEEEAATVEQELEQQKREAHALLVALKEQPGDAGLRQEVRQNLAALQKDADLVADKQLGQQTKHVLSALAAGGDAAQQIDAAMATLKPQMPEAPPPSAETIQLAQATAEEVDAELLGIFLEEADEVLASIDANLQRLRTQPHDVDLLTVIRRSAHTLKGSGRMVGLKDLGDTAWSIEQVLNLWLQQEQEVTPDLLDLIGQAHTVFSAWIEHLKTGQGQIPDAGGMVDLADALRGGSETLLLSPLASVAARPATERGETTAAELAIDAGVVAAAPIAALPAEPIQLPRAGLSIAPDLAEIFREEAAAHLATLEREFTRLQTDPAAPTTHEMYRAAHTLAGIAGTVGIPAVNCLSHALERALVRRNQAAQRDSLEAFETVRQAIAALALMLADVAREHEPEEFPPCSMSSAPCTRSRSSTSRQCPSRPTTERKQRRPNRRLRSVAQSQRPARPLPSTSHNFRTNLTSSCCPCSLKRRSISTRTSLRSCTPGAAIPPIPNRSADWRACSIPSRVAHAWPAR
jgi:chemosensory pili system protein ChpA (sensor histidine kinase/response regulator)